MNKVAVDKQLKQSFRGSDRVAAFLCVSSHQEEHLLQDAPPVCPKRLQSPLKKRTKSSFAELPLHEEILQGLLELDDDDDEGDITSLLTPDLDGSGNEAFHNSGSTWTTNVTVDDDIMCTVIDRWTAR